MTMKLHHYCLVIPVALMLQAGVSAQSLADVAKAEEKSGCMGALLVGGALVEAVRLVV